MWGNWIGWALSSLVVAFVGTMMWAMNRLGNATTQPTPSFLTAMPRIDPVNLPIAPETLVAMDDPGDAGTFYWQAIAEYHKNDRPYRHYNRKAPNAGLALPAIDLLAQGTHCKTMDLYASHPEQIVNYGEDRLLAWDDITILKDLARLAFMQGLMNQVGYKDADGKPVPPNLVETKRLYEAGFAVGAHLYRERLMYEELQRSEGIMSEGCDALKILAEAQHDDARTEQCENFKEAYLQYDASYIKPTWNLIQSLNPSMVSQNIGNVFYLAQKAQDRMWRDEAILTVGFYRFNNGGDLGRAADRHFAESQPAIWAQEITDPAVLSAAVMARDLTADRFRLMRNREPP